MERAALFCDATIDYRIPAEPDPGDMVTLRFRTARNDVDRVYLVLYGKEEKKRLRWAERRGRFDYYETTISVEETAVRFYFQVERVMRSAGTIGWE